MSSDFEKENSSKSQHAAQYLLREHGENAIKEAKSALQHAKDLGDQDTVDVFTDILNQLASLRL